MHILIFTCLYENKGLWKEWPQAFPRFDQLTYQNSVAQDDHKNKLQIMCYIDCSILIMLGTSKVTWVEKVCFGTYVHCSFTLL